MSIESGQACRYVCDGTEQEGLRCVFASPDGPLEFAMPKTAAGCVLEYAGGNLSMKYPDHARREPMNVEVKLVRFENGSVVISPELACMDGDDIVQTPVQAYFNEDGDWIIRDASEVGFTDLSETAEATPFQAAASALYERVSRVLSLDGLSVWTGIPHVPTVTFGHPVTVKPFAAWVDQLPQAVSTEGSATNWENAIAFTLSVYLVAKHSDRAAAVDAVQKYMASVWYGVMADATLGRTVGNAMPRIADAGTDRDESNMWYAAGVVEVRCSIFSACPKIFKEMVTC